MLLYPRESILFAWAAALLHKFIDVRFLRQASPVSGNREAAWAGRPRPRAHTTPPPTMQYHQMEEVTPYLACFTLPCLLLGDPAMATDSCCHDWASVAHHTLNTQCLHCLPNLSISSCYQVGRRVHHSLMETHSSASLVRSALRYHDIPSTCLSIARPTKLHLIA
jgi:hypothetical protein